CRRDRDGNFPGYFDKCGWGHYRNFSINTCASSQYFWESPASADCQIRNEQTLSCDLFTGQYMVYGTDI
ncbi:MAG: hypothetical protein J2O49_08940, partial [Sciscionella sp.]|nr:hypothetical protein [Sciscionella sp.]